MSGWIKLHRQIRKHWLWEDPQKLKWWIDLILSANHEDGKTFIKGQLVECKRGETVKSMETWAKEWGTTRPTVKRFMETLQSDEMIVLENVRVTTRVRINNYASFNDSDSGERSADNAADVPQTYGRRYTNKKEKNEKNEKKSIAPTIHEVECYFTENGYSVQAAQKAHEYYSLADWHDSKGNKVKNWKQKMQAVWFKPENKTSATIQQSLYVETDKDRY